MLATLAGAREADAKIKAAVDAGEMTVKEGAKRLQDRTKEMFPARVGGPDLDKIEQRINDVIAAGILTSTGVKIEILDTAGPGSREVRHDPVPLNWLDKIRPTDLHANGQERLMIHPCNSPLPRQK